MYFLQDYFYTKNNISKNEIKILINFFKSGLYYSFRS